MTEATNIRRATPADLGAIRQLLSQRDERPWTDPQVAWFLHDLDPAHALAWLAFVGDVPVALTSVFLRPLQVGDTRVRAAYWANLYIDPAHRDRMLYPRMPMTMFSALRPLGVQLLYAAVRRQDVAEAHTFIGFTRIGQFSVLAKPLRPARLLAKHRSLPALLRFTPPIDAAFSLVRAVLRPRGPAGITAVVVDDTHPFLQPTTRPVHHAWTAAAQAHRFRQTREGTHYERLELREGSTPIGHLIWRVAERGDPIAIRVGVIMDIAVPADRSELVRPALALLERRAHAAGCEALLVLDALGPGLHHQLRRAGFLSTSERYTLVLWPKSAPTELPALAAIEAWRFSFADHDAF